MIRARDPGNRQAERGAAPWCLVLWDEAFSQTISLGDSFFVHQLFVDAYTAQHANAATKPMTVAFALIGLYLVLDRGYTGRDAQLAHVRLARVKRDWPLFTVPKYGGRLTVESVAQRPPAISLEEAITSWATSVWKAWASQHDRVATLYATTP